MKSINETDQLIWDYLDGNATEQEVLHIRKKLEGDPDFQRKVGTMKQLHAGLSRRPLHEPPAGFSDRVMRRVQVQSRTAARPLLNIWVIRFIAFVFICCLSSAFFDGAGAPRVSISVWSMRGSLPSNLDWQAISLPVLLVNVILLMAIVDKIIRSSSGSRPAT